MSKKPRLSALGALVSTCFAASPCLANGTPQPESPVACSEPGPDTLEDGDHTTDCGIEPRTDTDQFQFVGVAGETWRILFSRVSNPTLDPHIEVFDPANDRIANCMATNNNLLCDALVDDTGSHRIVVSDVNIDETGTYVLHLIRMPPSFDPPLLNFGTAVMDVIDFRPDVDFFQIQAMGGITVRMLVSRISNPTLDPHLLIWSPSGSLVLDQFVVNGNLLVDVALPAEDGAYTFFLFDENIDETGSYNFEVQCLSPSCVLALPVCNLDLDFADGTLSLGFDLDTPAATTWKLRLILQGTLLEAISVPLPGGFELSNVAPIDNFPALGTVGFLSTFSDGPEGITCSDWETADTGPATFLPTVQYLRELFRKQ